LIVPNNFDADEDPKFSFSKWKFSLYHAHVTISTFRLCRRAWKHILCANGGRKFLINIKFLHRYTLEKKREKENLNATERWGKFSVSISCAGSAVTSTTKFPKQIFRTRLHFRCENAVDTMWMRYIWWVVSDMTITSSWFSIIRFLHIIVNHLQSTWLLSFLTKFINMKLRKFPNKCHVLS
jgi:hypothetical protein